MKKFAIISILFLLTACEQPQQPITESKAPIKQQSKPVELTGLWRGVLASPGGELPFGIDISKDQKTYSAKILNGEERADTSSVVFNNNEITINFDWFDARVKASLSEDGQSMTGQWSKTASGKDKTSMLPFTASKGYQHRFSQEILDIENTKVDGNWEVTFTDEDGDSIAVAVFQ